MKCARCGHDVPDDATQCPWCAKGYPPENEAPFQNPNSGYQQNCCPRCGSPHIHAERQGYNPGCGCLGWLLFSWAGLLLGLLGANDTKMVCDNCGASWPGKNSSSGCLSILLLVVAIVIIGKFCC